MWPWTSTGWSPTPSPRRSLRCSAAGRTVKFLYTIPNFHNPAGVTQTLERRTEILRVAERADLLVVEDNPYGLLGFDGDPVPAMRSLDEERVVYLGSFSKTFAPGFRVGWVLAPHAVREKLVLAQESATLCPPVFSQFAVAAYLHNHDWRGQIKVFREMYRERRDAMIAGLADHMPAGTSWTYPHGGFFVWVTLPPGLDSQAMLPRAVTARVAYVPGTAFYADGFGSRHMRLSYCFPTPERIIEGTRRLGEVLHLRDRGAGDLRHRAELDRGRSDVAAPDEAPGANQSLMIRQHDTMETVVVLSGGLSHERDVSLRSGRRVSPGPALAGRRGGRVRRRLRAAAPAGRAARCGGLPGAARRGRRGRGAARGARPARRAVRRLDRRPPAGSPSTSRSPPRWSPTPASRTPAQVALPHEIFRELGARRAGRGARPTRSASR